VIVVVLLVGHLFSVSIVRFNRRYPSHSEHEHVFLLLFLYMLIPCVSDISFIEYLLPCFAIFHPRTSYVLCLDGF
jgi:hypothetical protein